MDCRNNDPEYRKSISLTKSKQVISDEQKTSISVSLKAYYKNNPRPRRDTDTLKSYRLRCAFKFNLADYPVEFDFKLIEQYGWYSAKNRGNNLTGVSRDHLVSVRYGFDNNIPSEHLAHPANCALLRHGENVSKGIKNSITYEQLLKRIAEWDNTYPRLMRM